MTGVARVVTRQKLPVTPRATPLIHAAAGHAWRGGTRVPGSVLHVVTGSGLRARRLAAPVPGTRGTFPNTDLP